MFQTHVPSKILQPYIAFYYTIKCKKTDYDNIISEYNLPSGFGHMGFHFCGSFYVVQKKGEQELPRFYTVGQQTQHYYMNSDSSKVDLYAVTFKPTGLWHFFGLDMPSITDKAIATTSLFNNNIQKFTKQFDSQQGDKLKIKLIENLLINHLLTVNPQLNVIDSAIQRINETYGCCSITELISYLGINERYFQKQFKKMVGITPTVYKRIVRFNYMFAEIKNETPIDCKALIALFNYYDFSHFSKDFKKYCGACPSKFHIEKFKFLQELMASKAFLNPPL
ncbi:MULTISPECIES: AraC family transcriptional regulator [Aequorivita]|uniref:Helix-turn-helix transcriptional regulator n=1 Tax=Aequorivita lipolytica TaxID=153267 RepID=A0A5C6YN57_9FLAO|nr:MULTISPECIES: AraC family transcriptional regulator [Aequorivita]TXD68859.1 helix-turn-helix transcriptional regulator [Aequorivita lipolytica]SRX52120.1 hypothetical protein AEQU2_02099 [Aequorivita lipolytica]SRX55269.1 hypothetical protein AEQU1_02291 [Aequorivita sp. CIP111184]